VEAKHAYLERVAGADPERPAAGLVSFSRLFRVDEVKAATAGMKATVVFFRLPQSDPDARHLMVTSLDDAVADAAKEVADLVRAEIVAIEAQLRDAQASERDALTRSLEERRQALGGLGPDCACVYAVAAQDTTLGALATLQQRDGVLLVDVPEPVTSSLEGWELTPILPS
jgi:hypothetical protein